ncbi:hypothetical protein ACH4TX_42955 [Streptomyces sp. NPDC021098]|uniref:hypothetical protein n=1 Tax=unclassified Streptomyces TaxID=2593676 RepID=UPI0037B5024C
MRTALSPSGSPGTPTAGAPTAGSPTATPPAATGHRISETTAGPAKPPGTAATARLAFAAAGAGITTDGLFADASGMDRASGAGSWSGWWSG